MLVGLAQDVDTSTVLGAIATRPWERGERRRAIRLDYRFFDELLRLELLRELEDLRELLLFPLELFFDDVV